MVMCIINKISGENHAFLMKKETVDRWRRVRYIVYSIQNENEIGGMLYEKYSI